MEDNIMFKLDTQNETVDDIVKYMLNYSHQYANVEFKDNNILIYKEKRTA